MTYLRVVLGLALLASSMSRSLSAQELASGVWSGVLNLANGITLNVELAVGSSGMTISVLGGGSGPVTDVDLGERDFAFVWGVFECKLSRSGSEDMGGRCTASDGTEATMELAGPTGGSGAEPAPQENIPRDAVRRDELMETGAPDLYAAIRRVRPRWLQARGETRFGRRARVRVYVNRQPMGWTEALENIQIEEVEAVWFLTATDATFEFGSDNEGGAILVLSRRR